jgi:predicted nucleic acid-binding protein
MSDAPRSGDRVVVDANILADWVGGLATVRAGVAIALDKVCCVVCYSTKLRKEAVGAVARRGAPLSRRRMVDWLDAAAKRGKFRHVTSNKVEQSALDRGVSDLLPPEDVHVVTTARAAGARWIVTADTGLQRAGERAGVRELVEILSVESLIDLLPGPPGP